MPTKNVYLEIIADNEMLADLELSWNTAEFTSEDGLGPMATLHQAGDALVAVGRLNDDGPEILGSGVMVGPGLLLTATHVLDEFKKNSPPPLFMTFLESGTRAWLPKDVTTLSGPSEFGHDRQVVSDISLVGCTLNSDALVDHPLMLAPMQVALPLIGERLWAFGFRHGGIKGGAALLTPLVSSGLVTATFPRGRGERLASSCIEVDMDVRGGMSGGAVVNSDGFLVGIVSASVSDGGPTYVTLIWEALRMRVKSSAPKLQKVPLISLIGAHAEGLVKLKGNFNRDPFGNIKLSLSADEGQLMVASLSDAHRADMRQNALDGDELEAFLEGWGSEMEDVTSEAALRSLAGLSLPKMREFLEGSAIPPACLEGIQAFSVEVFEGVEELDVTKSEAMENGSIEFAFTIDVRSLIWTVDVDMVAFAALEVDFRRAFFNVREENGVMRMETIQRRYFRGNVVFDREAECFGDPVIELSALHPPRQ